MADADWKCRNHEVLERGTTLLADLKSFVADHGYNAMEIFAHNDLRQAIRALEHLVLPGGDAMLWFPVLEGEEPPEQERFGLMFDVVLPGHLRQCHGYTTYASNASLIKLEAEHNRIHEDPTAKYLGHYHSEA